MYKLLALDMDGTLLTDRKTMTKHVRMELKKLINRDIGVTIATGRFPASAWLHGQSLGLKVPLVSLNGAVILDPVTGEEIESMPVETEVAKKITSFCEEHDVYVHYHGYNVLYVEKINQLNNAWAIANVVVDETKELIEENYLDQLAHFHIEEVETFEKFYNNHDHPTVYKATVINNDPKLIEELYQIVSKWSEISVTRTGSKRFDINAANVSKKTALKKICRIQGISKDDVVAVGDYDNDAEMLKWAGLGIAMGNGNDYIKSIADAETLSNEKDGVVKIVEKYFI